MRLTAGGADGPPSLGSSKSGAPAGRRALRRGGLLLSERVVITAVDVVFVDDGSASEVLVRGFNDPSS